jgi:hypothetical protein
MELVADTTEVLLTLAEISVAFAGFSSVVAIFQQTASPDGDAFDLFRFWVMLEFSLAALFFSLLPLLLHFLGLSDAAVWSVSGAALIAFLVGHGVFTRRLIRRGQPQVVASLTRGLSISGGVVFLTIVVSQALNLAGVLGRSFGPYLLGLLLLLLGAGVNFVRLVWVGNRPLLR